MNVFNSVEGLHPRRNAFSAHTYRNDFTANLGVNIPVYLQEVPPATRVRCNAAALVRLQALIAPVMDNIDYYVHFWQIPYRLLENDRFTAFISGEIEPSEYDALFLTPVELVTNISEVTGTDLGIWGLILGNIGETPAEYVAAYESIVGNGSLLDFLGYDRDLFPVITYNSGDAEYVITGGNNTQKFNWRGVIAYLMLHLHWYMNENVEYYEGFNVDIDNLLKQQDQFSLSKLLVNVLVAFDSNMYPHGWEKDYFTSGLPNVQYGEPVTLPMAGTAPVTIDNAQQLSMVGVSPSTGIRVVLDASISENDSVGLVGYGDIPGDAGSRNTRLATNDGEMVDRIDGTLQNELRGTADLSEATAISINELRFANALQKFKERRMRFGRRRLEYYKGFFDVTPEDLRLQVPKYLGGGRMPINISDIEQTSSTSGEQALGRLAGKATGLAAGLAGFTTFCSEETIIIGIAFAMPHITYAKAVSRFKFKTNDIYDYFNPSFEHLGEQAIKKVEIYSGSNDPDGDFAYTPRYNEYRFHMNEMHGAFKDTLSYWTLGRIFDGQPALNADFVYMQPKNFNRIFAVEGEPPMLVSMIFRQRIVQPVSKYGTPMLLA